MAICRQLHESLLFSLSLCLTTNAHTDTAASVNKVAPMSSAQWYYTGGEMEGSKTVQQLLRPPDTCTFISFFFT